jgi:hypothetical protein
MASIPGSHYDVFAPGQTVNFNLTYDPNSFGPPVPGEFNLEVIINATGTGNYPTPPGYQGVLIESVPGKTVPPTVTMLHGNYGLVDAGGNDQIFLGDGSESVQGASGDTLAGGTGLNQFLDAHLGNQSVTGGSGGTETIFGGPGDTIHGGSGGNETIASGGGDTIIGGSGGNEFIDGTQGGQSIVGGTGGNETIWGGPGDTIQGGSGGNERLPASPARRSPAAPPTPSSMRPRAATRSWPAAATPRCLAAVTIQSKACRADRHRSALPAATKRSGTMARQRAATTRSPRSARPAATASR